MNTHRTLLGLVLLAGLAFGQQEENPAALVESLITEDSMAAPLSYLASDLLEGRGVGSRGDQLARLYLQSQMRMHGIKPGGPDGAWEQKVPIVKMTTKIITPLSVESKSGRRAEFTAPSDYVAFAGRPTEKPSWNNCELVFVGYGIHALEQEWDDYKNVDLKGKVLLVMNNDPSKDPNLFAGKTRLYYGRWSYKYEEAARRGAVGAIVIHTTPSAGYPFQVIQAGHEQADFWLPFEDDQPNLEIRSWCSEEAARLMCKVGGFNLDELRAQAETREFQPVPLGVKVNLTTENTMETNQSANVLGILEGSDPDLKDEYVVATAHFDHLGVGRPVQEDTIYNGALDNASGCSALINLMRALSHMDPKPRRSILFAFVTAEESGLLGSLYYSRNPTIPKKQLVANFNIDGINIWGETRDIGMIGHGKNSLTELAQLVAAGRGRTVKPDAEPDKGLFYRSDHFSFARIGVPAAYFKAGNDFLESGDKRRRVKRAYTTVHYHQPSDQFDARWNLDGAVADTRMILECLARVANGDDAPTWTPGDEFEKLR